MSEQDFRHRLTADSVGRALELVGERWTLLILRETFFGVRRYGQLARNLGIPRPTLSARLKRLVEAGLLEKVAYEEDKHEYRLTDSGKGLFPAVIALMTWGDTYLPSPEGPPILLRHNDCGEHADPFLACGHCGGEITTNAVTPEPGPGFVSR
ncbi:winged helix-turn-helix transcriptional regulator [Amycolatopsis sp. NPDC059657]|uniref:winged helix-turn-helix transcriptional regulator n=1 Tax=Amycolatopsis sp. NPDC059657 TaxID=3346899 RepID=UPI003672F069